MYDVLIIGPGGMKGFLCLGYLEALIKLKKEEFQSIKYFCGTSIGALISLLLIIGLTPREITYFLLKEDIIKNMSIENINNLFKNVGITSLNKLKKELENKIIEKFGSNLTLKGLYKLTKKTLITTTYNLTEEKGEYLEKNSYPNLKCVDAVLASMSIPLIFQKFYINNKIYIDGAFFNPFPVEYFNDENHYIIVISMNEKIELETEENFLSFVNKIINTLCNNKNKVKSDKVKYVDLFTDIKSALGLPLSLENKGSLFCQGFLSFFLNEEEKKEMEKFNYNEEDKLLLKIKENIIYPI